MSGKGGVGKSTIAVNLACALCHQGRKTGILDSDIHGPSLKTMLKVCSEGAMNTPIAAAFSSDLVAASTSFFLDADDTPLIWRGPMVSSMIKRFFEDMVWPELDYLVIDTPPGTGDEQLTVIQTLDRVDYAVVVATPQEVALTDVRKAVQFLRHMRVTNIGVIENMSGFICPHCGTQTDIFKRGSVADLAEKYAVSYLGHIPFDTDIVASSDAGDPYVCSRPERAGAITMATIAKKIDEFLVPSKSL